MASPDIEGILDLYSSVCCFTYSAAALVLYDHLITFDAEVKLFWTHKLSGASILFFVIRYFALMNYTLIGTIATAVPVSDYVCGNLIRATFAINVLQYIPWGAMSALRVLALSRMNWMLSAVVFLLSEAPIVQYRTSVILADILVIVVTVAATWRQGAPRIGTSSLGTTLLYNAVVLTHLSIAIVAQQASYITGVAEPLTAILVSRLLLDLQAANRGSGPNSQILDSSGSANGTLKFARVMGSLGTSERLETGNFELDGICSEGGENGEVEDGSEDNPGRLEDSAHV
ncbi:hypothetical protein C8Q78DRAFT_989459 [Trametes maxima]|nr:hypothetical protein C8Q78DRAFT_989459 [Trametes maxima]